MTHFSNRIPIGLTAITLFMRSPVNSDRCAAVFGNDAGDKFVITAMLLSQTNLAGYRHIYGGT